MLAIELLIRKFEFDKIMKILKTLLYFEKYHFPKCILYIRFSFCVFHNIRLFYIFYNKQIDMKIKIYAKSFVTKVKNNKKTKEDALK